MRTFTQFTFAMLITVALILHCGSTDVTTEKGTGLNVLVVLDVQPTGDLSYQDFDMDTMHLGDTIIAYEDMLTMDTLDWTIEMRHPKDTILAGIPSSVYGTPFVVVLDDKRIFTGFFWSNISSVPCHRPMIMVDPPDTTSLIRIENIGAASIPAGTPDYRAIVDRLIQDGKAR